MNKKQHVYHTWVQELRKTGWDVDKQDCIKFNHGSETKKHQHAKLATASILREENYRIDTEVEHPERGEIDVIAIPTQDDQRPFAVELETAPTQETIASKLARYHNGTPFTECWVIDLNTITLNVLEMEEQIRQELGL